MVQLLSLASDSVLRTSDFVTQPRAAVATPFPGTWRSLLTEAYDHYDRLPGEWRERFERDLQLFLAQKRITGVGVEATEELRLLVAASAVTLSLGWPDYEWHQLAEVLLYADDFDRDYAVGKSDLTKFHFLL